MPWAPSDARRHTALADTPKIQKRWAEVANKVLSDTEDEGRAIREANKVASVMHGDRQQRQSVKWL